MSDQNKNPDLPPKDCGEENEVLRASRLAKSVAPGKRSLGWKTAAGIGIGSGAVIAALLYARGSRK